MCYLRPKIVRFSSPDSLHTGGSPSSYWTLILDFGLVSVSALLPGTQPLWVLHWKARSCQGQLLPGGFDLQSLSQHQELLKARAAAVCWVSGGVSPCACGLGSTNTSRTQWSSISDSLPWGFPLSGVVPHRFSLLWQPELQPLSLNQVGLLLCARSFLPGALSLLCPPEVRMREAHRRGFPPFLQGLQHLGFPLHGLLPDAYKQMWWVLFSFYSCFSSNHKLFCCQKQKSGGNHFNRHCYFPTVASLSDNLVVTRSHERAPGLFMCSFIH